MIGAAKSKAKAHAIMLLRAAVLGVSFTIVKHVSDNGIVLLVTAARFIVAGLALFPFVLLTSKRTPTTSGWLLYAMLGVCQAAFYGSMFWAAHLLSALEMALIYVTVPFLSYVIGLPFEVEEPSAGLVGILILGAAGALGLAWAESRSNAMTLSFGPAVFIYFIGCIGLALYSVLARWGLARGQLTGNAAVRSFLSILIAALIMSVLGLSSEAPAKFLSLSATDLLWLGYLGAISTAGTVWLMQQAAPVLSPATATAYSYAPPFVSLVLLFLAKPQSISWTWLPGAALIVLAVTLLVRRDLKPRAKRAQTADEPLFGPQMRRYS